MAQQHPEKPAAPQPAGGNTADRAQIRPIGCVRSDFNQKFGIPRQSGLVQELTARVVLLPEYRNPDAFRGIEGFSHLWLIWQFSETVRQEWRPTVRPPRLGGNTRVGVFATRSPYRPNPIGLSSVRLLRVDYDDPEGPVLIIGGADLLDGTPVYDIKPYLAYADSHPEAVDGFAAAAQDYAVQVDFPEELLNRLPAEKRAAVCGVLAQDPRPAYQNDPDRVYGMTFAGWDIRFTVKDKTLTVTDAAPAGRKD